jgi:Fe2+ transport system protein B
VKDFTTDVATVFMGVCLLAAFAAWAGLLGLLDRLLAPLMAVLKLPGQVGEAVVLSAVRKNGMAAVLVDGAGGLKAPLNSASQVLAAVFLAGVLVPCIVTVLAIGRELGWRKLGTMLARQAIAACLITAGIAWSGAWCGF